MLSKRLIKSNNAGGGGCTNTVDLYNPFPDGGGVALYQLNGDATDVSGNYDGTATNVTYGAGQFGQAGVFNGAATDGSVIQITNDSFFRQKQTMSVSLWFKTNGSATQSLRLFTDYNSVSYNIFSQITSTGEISVINRFNNNTNTFTSSNTYDDSNWHNLVITNNVSSLIQNIYVDGEFIGNNSMSSSSWSTGSTGKVGIGASWSTANTRWQNSFNGSIDQVRIFSRALRPYEVEALYTEEYCTPTIVPSEHFNTVTYTGNGSTQSITGVGFQPDFVWAKKRSAAQDHIINDSVRGVQKELVPNNTSAEYTTSNGLSSFDSDGFTTGANNSLNTSGSTYAAWNFKAGGAAVTNTDGTITSQVSANTEAGFSVVTWTGNDSAATIGHGLGTTPAMVIVKSRDGVRQWFVYHKQLNNGVNTGQYFLSLNLTDPEFYNINSVWNGLAPTSTVVNLGASANFTGGEIAYCFAEVEGFSNFGSYVGTGVVGNVSVVTGFEPAMIIAKRTDAGSSNWFIWDNKRDTTNPNGTYLLPNASNAENDLDAYGINFLENGFTVNSSDPQLNANGGEYIYMAFAADPTAVEPTLEDSFNTVLYTGTGASRSITGVGFQPDFTWIKGRSDAADYHNLFDSVRGADRVLISNLTNAEYDGGGSAYFPSFDSDGFSLSGNAIVNGSGQTYVAWNWKGAEIPAINSNGSIPSVVSANPAAGFSIVSWTSTGSNTSSKTVGHGLGNTPNVVILKNRSTDTSWRVYHSGIPSPNNTLALNSTEVAFDFFPSVSSTNFGLANSITTGESSGASGQNIIAYCFAEVSGFSKFGSYSGSHPTRQTIDCGFEPAFVIIKSTNTTKDWVIFDNKRFSNNEYDAYLAANTSAAEAYMPNLSNYTVEFLSNGFSVQDGSFVNLTGTNYIFMAFANQF